MRPIVAKVTQSQWIPQLLVRLFIGYFFFETGLAKIGNLDRMAERFTGWGIPFPAFSATLSGYTELIGGALLMLGLATRLAAIPLFINMVVAILVVNIKKVSDLDEFVELSEPLYALVFLWLFFSGSGRASLDRVLSKSAPGLAAIMGLGLVLGLTAPAGAVDGLVTTRSASSVAETMDRLERAVKDRGLIVLTRVDHAAAAQKAGLSLRPTQLLIFGNPKAGTPLMQSAQSSGIDLPLKALAWEDDQGQTWLAYNDPRWLAARHGVSDRAEVIKAMTGVLEALADTATKTMR